MRNIFVDMQISIQNIKAVKAKAVLKLQKENVFVSNTSIRQFLVTPRHQSSGWISDKHGDWWVVSDGVFVLKIIWEFFEEKGGSGVGGEEWRSWSVAQMRWVCRPLAVIFTEFCCCWFCFDFVSKIYFEVYFRTNTRTVILLSLVP